MRVLYLILQNWCLLAWLRLHRVIQIDLGFLLRTAVLRLLHDLRLQRLELGLALNQVIGFLEITGQPCCLLVAVAFEFNLCANGLPVVIYLLQDLLVTIRHFRVVEIEIGKELLRILLTCLNLAL